MLNHLASAPAAPEPSPLNLDDCEVALKVKVDREHPRVLRNIRVTVRHPVYKEVVSLLVLQIERDQCRVAADFHQILDEELDELATFSTKLFDRFGNVRPWLTKDELLSGTGCWSEELNSGTLFYLLFVNVKDPALMGQGLGSFALNEFLTSEHVKLNDIVITWPSPMPSRQEKSKAQWDEEMARSVAFVRKNYFRRIGLTQFFAFSPNPNHPSRAIPADEDAEQLPKAVRIDAGRDLRLNSSLHGTIYNNKEPSIESKIRRAFVDDPASIRQRDQNGFTPLHVAADAGNIIATRTLLELGATDDASDRANADAMTPLMLCEGQLRSTKEFVDMFAIKWEGHSEDRLLVKAALKRAMGEDVGADEEFVLKNKWDCTCGQCAGGWLSPSMLHRLITHADWVFDTMGLEEEPSFPTRGVPIDPADIPGSPSLTYIPVSLYPSIFKTFYSGFRYIFGAMSQVFAELRDNPCRVLSATDLRARIMSKLSGRSPWLYHMPYFHSSAIDFYFAKGGELEYALDCAMNFPEDCMLSTGIPATEQQVKDEFAPYPKCSNDLEAQLVRHNMGLTPERQWGPYGEAKAFLESDLLFDGRDDQDCEEDEDESEEDEDDSEEDEDSSEEDEDESEDDEEGNEEYTDDSE